MFVWADPQGILHPPVTSGAGDVKRISTPGQGQLGLPIVKPEGQVEWEIIYPVIYLQTIEIKQKFKINAGERNLS